MAEILGTTPSEMVGRPSFAYVFPEDVEAAQRLFQAKVRGDKTRFTSSCAERMARLFGSMSRDSDAQCLGRIQGNRRHIQRKMRTALAICEQSDIKLPVCPLDSTSAGRRYGDWH